MKDELEQLRAERAQGREPFSPCTGSGVECIAVHALRKLEGNWSRLNEILDLTEYTCDEVLNCHHCRIELHARAFVANHKTSDRELWCPEPCITNNFGPGRSELTECTAMTKTDRDRVVLAIQRHTNCSEQTVNLPRLGELAPSVEFHNPPGLISDFTTSDPEKPGSRFVTKAQLLKQMALVEKSVLVDCILANTETPRVDLEKLSTDRLAKYLYDNIAPGNYLSLNMGKTENTIILQFVRKERAGEFSHKNSHRHLTVGNTTMLFIDVAPPHPDTVPVDQIHGTGTYADM